MRISVGTFKVTVISAFVIIAGICIFRNYPLPEQILIVRDTSETSVTEDVPSTTLATSTKPLEASTGTSAQSSAESTATVSKTQDIEPNYTSEPQTVPEAPPQNSEPQTVSEVPPRPSEPQTVPEAPPQNSEPQNSGLININTASAAQLKTLKGIGDVKAQAIIDYRDAHGDFSRIEDITEVKGIGEKTFEKIRDYITV